MADWDPALYRRYEDERTRPARELLARVPHAAPRRVVDLGCGPGNSTELLVERWPDAEVVGLDNSPSMLASARQRLPRTPFVEADIATWRAPAPVDVIYTNATLQWLGDHRALLPRLFGELAPGGALAVQMPDNLDEPSHRAMREVAARPQFAAAGGAAATRQATCTVTGQTGEREELLGPAGYYELLAPLAASVDVWRTTYHHPMTSPAAIVEWLRGTGLRPFLDRLPSAAQADYLAAYERRIDAAYPRLPDGKRLLAFPRLFIVALKAGDS
ncbi:MAG TPA: trans-aconitate 2-methyltransferase [Caldimonas sp.]|nr:trans-aconitate 2-methyltransferase [Caldimonas sp.]